MEFDENISDPRLLTVPILAQMRKIDGWLKDDEARLLIAATARALATPGDRPAVVEIGSYCGRSTVVLGCATKIICPDARVYAIDPHKGYVRVTNHTVWRRGPTFERFRRNISDAGLVEIVHPIVQYSYQVQWYQPIRLLYIDGFHDYENVARDFWHFESWVDPEGYIAFHDYAPQFPGVVAVVEEALVCGRYQKACRVGTLMVLQRIACPT